jgi:hypothetical protein
VQPNLPNPENRKWPDRKKQESKLGTLGQKLKTTQQRKTLALPFRIPPAKPANTSELASSDILK